MRRASLRVLHVAAMPFPSRQGTQVYVEQLCRGQGERGHDVHLLTYHHGLGGPWASAGFRLHRLPDFPRERSLRSGPSVRKAALDASLAWRVRGLVRELRPDVVHAHNYEALASCLLAGGLRYPLVYHAHTLMEPELPTYFRARIARAAASVSGLVADRVLPAMAPLCVTVTPYLRDALVRRGVGEGRAIYIPPALFPETARQASRRAALSGEPADFVYIGNLDRYQGLDDLIEGFSRLVRAGRPVRLRIISDSDPAECRGRARALGVERAVVFEPHGDFSTVPGRLAASRIALAPRRVPGGFPIKIINYLFAGKPVIASQHGAGGLRHGREALLYGSIDGFVEAAASLLDDERLMRRIAAGGRRAARASFTWTRCLPMLDDVYGTLLGRRGNGAQRRSA